MRVSLSLAPIASLATVQPDMWMVTLIRSLQTPTAAFRITTAAATVTTSLSK
jgi:hypothetical protein